MDVRAQPGDDTIHFLPEIRHGFSEARACENHHWDAVAGLISLG